VVEDEEQDEDGSYRELNPKLYLRPGLTEKDVE
jgi:hypothetical protein